MTPQLRVWAYTHSYAYIWASLVAQLVKNLPARSGRHGFDPWVRKSPLEKGKATPLQYSGLENSMDCNPWGCKESDTTERLSRSLSRSRVEPERQRKREEYLLFFGSLVF